MVNSSGTIRSWENLSDLVWKFFKSGWIFRGVKKKSYTLRAGIGRDDARKDSRTGLNLPYSAEEEKRLLRLFMREARTRFDWEPKTELEWMILGQHHRLPTRLLDWTESILVAAFFAVEVKDAEEPACIYGVEPPSEVQGLNVDPFGDEIGSSPRLIRPPHINPRITAQKGVLTIHPEPHKDWQDNGIYCWEIDQTFVFTLKGVLDFCGIHAGSLFPDSADRHTEHLRWLHKWNRVN